MKIQQIYTGCIAQAAYYLEHNGEAAVFDPLRETQPYLQRAATDNAKIKYIFETHFHADFVSGHLDLAKKTGAQIVFGPTAKPHFDCVVATDGEKFRIGGYTVTAIHTPGHTLESTCWLLTDENGRDYGIITGDTLFIGDVGRPDLAQKSAEGLTTEKLAAMLYRSLRERIMPLADDLIVFPSHGAGSACGKNMSKETTDTLGNQKRTNYALRPDMTESEFVTELLDGLGAPPAYFPQNVMLNIGGYDSLDAVMRESLKPMPPAKFISVAQQTGAVVLDVRHEDLFTASHIPGSIFIGLQGNFAPWAGAVLMDVDRPLLLVTPEGKEEEAIMRLSRVGFDKVLGYLEGGIEAWVSAGFQTDNIESISPETFASGLRSKPVVDARKPGEFNAGHIEGAVNISLDTVHEHFAEIPAQSFYLHCQGGYRSVIMASVLKARGIHHAVNVEKGFVGIKNAGVPVVETACTKA